MGNMSNNMCTIRLIITLTIQQKQYYNLHYIFILRQQVYTPCKYEYSSTYIGIPIFCELEHVQHM